MLPDPDLSRFPDRRPLTAERRSLLEGIVAEGTRRRQTRMVGAGAALVLVVGLMAATLTGVGEGDRDRQLLAAEGGTSTSVVVPADPATPTSTSTAPTTETSIGTDGPATTTVAPATSTTVAAAVPPSGAWSALPPSGVVPRFGGVRAWTGRELIVWAGETGTTDVVCEAPCGPLPVFDGVIFNPATNAWRRMAPGPVPTAVPGGAWTGSELVVWGGAGTPVSAAYDPARDTWRTLPAGPLAAGWKPIVVALGDEVYVIRTGPPSGPGAAALNPATGTWRVLPDPPANDGVVGAGVIGGEVVFAVHGPEGSGAIVAALAPSGRWRVVARVPAVNQYFSSAVITGGGIWITGCRDVDSSVSESVVKRVDPSTGAVNDRPGPVAGECPQLVAAGGDVLALTPIPDEYQPQSLRAHQVVGDGWKELNPAPGSRVGDATWTGSEVLFWGGCACGGLAGSAIEAGYRLRL